jgi:hypothetical protein
MTAKDDVVQIVREELAKSLGEKIARAFEFYVQADLAYSDPSIFQRALLLMMGSTSANRALGNIVVSLREKFSLAPSVQTLAECVQTLRSNEPR